VIEDNLKIICQKTSKNKRESNETHQLQFSPLLSVSTYLVIFPPVARATLCRYREMMMMVMMMVMMVMKMMMLEKNGS